MKNIGKKKAMEDITDFLPKYPNINKKSNPNLNPYGDENFYESIFRKKEFHDLRLEKQENVLDLSPGDLLKNQQIIARFLSSRTPYKGALLDHQMGTGKTCALIGAIEQIKNEKNTFKGALIFAKGEGLLNNFTKELLFRCTSGDYIPENFTSLTAKEKVRRINKKVRAFYSLNTFRKFAGALSKMSDQDVAKSYSNYVIGIDEVHNLRRHEKVDGLNLYEQFYRLCHLTKNTKIILLSGTPMKDVPEEIADVLNLILPEDRALPTGKDFIQAYFDDDDGRYRFKEDMKEEFKSKVRGYVSYLKSMHSDARKVFAGEPYGKLEHFKIVPEIMSEFQSDGYDQAYENDTNSKDVFNNARQASLFVFPDGSYGSKGFDKYISSGSKKSKIKGTKRNVFAMKPELRTALYSNDKEEMLQKIAKYSKIYSSTIRSILDAQEKGENVFVYCSLVKGSGAILFSLLLQLFGFKSARGGERTEEPRYGIISNETASQTEIRNIIDTFNRPENMRGGVINVIIGSKVIGEGFSLMNVREENILTPHWNYSETDQAIARGYRLGSAKGLQEAGLDSTLTVYQRASISQTDNYPSIDLHMYEISEIKDVIVKQIDRLLMEASFDCGLTYARNKEIDLDGLRDCEYMECDYSCDGLDMDNVKEGLPSEELDYSTYELYYNSDAIDNVVSAVIDLYRTTFRMNLENIYELFPSNTRFEVLSALRKLINESTLIVNRYGFPAYLREDRNIYFLVDSLTVSGELFSVYYTRRPELIVPSNFNKIVSELFDKSIDGWIDVLARTKDIDDSQSILLKLPIKVQEMLLEYSILSKSIGLERNKEMRDNIIEIYNVYIKNIEETVVSTLLYSEDDNLPLRCLEGERWIDCPKEFEELLTKERKEKKSGLEKNRYGFYGLFNPESGQFCIRDVRGVDMEKESKDDRNIKSGKVCSTWTREDLTRIAAEYLKIAPRPIEGYKNTFKKYEAIEKLRKKDDRDELEVRVWNNDKLKFWHDQDIIESLSDENLLSGLYWSEIQKQAFCEVIADWFVENGLYDEDKGCGKQKGKKKA